jgi:chemotaxis protein MotC
MRTRPLLVALASLGLAGPALAAGDSELQPYQMVRSLQLVQDRIASGDDAALPMQRKLLEMIDQRLRRAGSHDFVDLRNYQAMLVYAMSGGNPATIDTLLSKLHLDENDRALGVGILGYLRGDPATSREALAAVDPLTQPPELGAFLALVKGSITAAEDPAAAQKMFDEARLLSPGTLVEEAALRRSIALGSETKDSAAFLFSCSQYVRRFLQSPYASQFADAFVVGVVALHRNVELAAIEEIVAGMAPEQQKVIYLRLARRAAIEGIPELTEYASAKADAVRIDGIVSGNDPRALLYSSLAAITSETVDQTIAKLKGIDRSRLSESDRQLLAAAEAIAAEVTAAPATPATPVQAATEAEPPAAHADAAADAAPADDLPEAEPLDAAETHEPAPAAAPPVVAAAPPALVPAPVPTEPVTQVPAAAPAETMPADAADPTAEVVADARKKLEEIDKLMKDTAQ